MRHVLLLALLVVAGCSRNTLDRQTATEKINQEFNKQRERLPLKIGRVGSHCETRTNDDGKTHDVDLNPTFDTASLIAHAAGFADIVPDGAGFWKISLTDQGRAFANSYHIVPEDPDPSSHCGYKVYSLPLATAQVSEVTGIVPEERVSQVEFNWKWSLTDLGQGLKADGKVYGALDDVHRQSLKDWLWGNPGPTLPIPVPSDEELKAPHHETVQFVKYDDGWRVK